jgi:hypothetical protein
LSEVAIEDLGEAGFAGVFGVENRVVQVLHLLPEGKHLVPLSDSGHQERGVGRQFQLVDLAEKPLDLGKARRFMAGHREIEFFFRPRFRLAAQCSEPLSHDANDKNQRVTVLVQRVRPERRDRV